MNTSAHSINDIINRPNNELASLLNRVNQLKTLDKLIKELLPESLKNRCSVANLAKQRLTLVTASGTWATQLRYRSSELLHKLRQVEAYAAIAKIHIIVDPSRV